MTNNQQRAAEDAVRKGEFAKAAMLLQDLCDASGTAESWLMLGVAEHKSGKLESAEKSIKKSLSLCNTSDGWSSLGGLFVSMNRFEEAIECYRNGMGKDSTSNFAMLNLITLECIREPSKQVLPGYKGNLDAGMQIAIQQIERGDNVPWCYFDLAQIRFFQNASNKELLECLSPAMDICQPWEVESAIKTYEMLEKNSVDLTKRAANALSVLSDLSNRNSGQPKNEK